MTEIMHYDEARRALAEALTLDEVKEIADKAAAIKEYARRAGDRQMEIDAAELRDRAERRYGELAKDQPKAKGARGVGPIAVPKENRNEPPTLAELGVSKKLSSRAQKLAAIPEAEFERRLALRRQNAERAGGRVTAKLIRDVDKKQARATREKKLGAKQLALPDRKYGVIVADPEWQWEAWSHETGMDRAAANHYPTSILPVIAERPVESIAAKDCVLFLWATIPMLPHALTVMAAWGFDYKSHYAWGKDRFGTGYWSREKHELLLIGTRGKIPCPAPGEQRSSLIEAPRGEHSAKPEVFLEMIEQYYPTLPKIELNRRGEPRPGWDAWGYEAAEAA